jgi:oxygen-independent coproporphyrinogen-3 oxidase
MAGIYIHIPFCRKICHYCDFYKVISPENTKPLLDALLLEASQRNDYLAQEKVSTIYFGGGTPSVLKVSELQHIIDKLRKIYDFYQEQEITIEINPDDIDNQYINALRKSDFNRISLGIQSWKNEDLKFLNRRHDAARAEKALGDILSAGFENVTVDLIYGLPGMTSCGLKENLDKTLEFDVKHISAYHLTIEPGTPLGKMKKEGKISEPDEEESTNQFNILIETLEAAGFIHYEISNFGKERFFSRHNTNYWKQVTYIGLGPSAHSFNNYSRQWNISDAGKYIKAVNAKKPFYEKEELDMRARFNEYVMTSLRTMWGIDMEYVEKVFEKEGYDYILNLSGKFRDYGLMKYENNSLVLTNQGKMISDNIISEFMMTARD